MKSVKKSILVLLLILISGSGFSQDQTTDTTFQAIATMQGLLNNLSKIKISGYLQGQFQIADSIGIGSYAGGNFPAATDKRFNVRRGRVKVMYDNTITQFVIQIDATEKGVGLKDAYAKVTEPWLQTFALTVGVQDRPFGYEIGYSSSLREAPERGRMSQILFPGERDLGAKLTIEFPKTSSFNFFKFEAGLFNGTGGVNSDFDTQKDFIAHLTLRKALFDEKMRLSGGVSAYTGGWRLDTTKLYSSLDRNSSGQLAFILDSDTSTTGRLAQRNYYGIDLQVSYETPFIGMTTFRAEFIGGVHAGTKSNTDSPREQPKDSKTTLLLPAYERNFNGAYFYLLQNIGHLPFQAVLKYDWYDPNTDVKGDDITSALTSADIKFSTFGFGLVYKFDQNMKFTAYYDLVKNESTQLSNYTQDRKDNVFTLRMQYKF